ncbi:chymotrypsin-like protease CTRL-1 [Haliotis asinina]|uniref:chymotrypsin-like protease CTRL-1 n=1 Tax=Haliotis asinina TaxID=109174 RepID=UPI00353180D7
MWTFPFLITLVTLVSSSLLSTVTTSAESNVTCGVPKVVPATSRVVNGQEARHGAWPWMVLLQEMTVPVCGGAVLNKHLILTAAHCFDEAISKNVARWQAVGGKHNADRYDVTQRTYHLKKLVIHEHYDSHTVLNDIALLLLHETIDYTDYIRPVCLPSSSERLYVGQHCYLAGWGDTLGTGNDNALNQALLPLISDNVCSRPDWYGSQFTPSTMLCAGYAAGGKDACSGDSGSPLVCKHGDKWYAEGIASWGWGCAEQNSPGLYTEVSKYVHWIHAKAAELGYPIKS